MDLIQIDRRLSEELAPLTFGPPTAYVYDPLTYAREPHEAYLSRFGDGPKEVVLLGMNPGPFGMAQTGVPFGDPEMVRDWMGIEGEVGKPPEEHPKRPILGLSSPRSEVSGSRLWGWARDRFGTADAFYERFFVLNFCPLVFMEESGRNRVPEKLPKEEREPLFEACERAVRESVQLLEPRFVVGVGKFAEERARSIFPDADFTIGRILHPSPASPLANRGWRAPAEEALRELGIDL
ncbi:MAG: single-stranded DNA-binding protein [Gemmatimonadota bacterium]|nr:single-stranded DNA-binding protein [Gemmatimonadota bacterium]